MAASEKEVIQPTAASSVYGGGTREAKLLPSSLVNDAPLRKGRKCVDLSHGRPIGSDPVRHQGALLRCFLVIAQLMDRNMKSKATFDGVEVSLAKCLGPSGSNRRIAAQRESLQEDETTVFGSRSFSKLFSLCV